MSVKLYDKWVHSFEEDEENESVYRPASFSFPRSRVVREAFEIHSNGDFVYYKPSQDDRRHPIKGKYILKDDRLKAVANGITIEINTSELSQQKLIVNNK